MLTERQAITALKAAITTLRAELHPDVTALRALFLLEVAGAGGQSIERKDLEALASQSGAITQGATSANVRALTDKAKNSTGKPLIETYRSSENESMKPIRITAAGREVVNRAIQAALDAIERTKP